MEKIKNNLNNHQWIVTFNGIDVGHVKLVDNESGIAIHDKYHGLGIGKPAYTLFLKKLEEYGERKITVQVRLDRPVSVKFEEKLGFVNKGIIYKNNKPYAYELEKIIS